MHLLFPVVAVLLLFSHSIFPLIFNESYRESAVIFNIYLLLIIPRLIFPQSILMGSKKLWLLMWISGGELILNITFSLIFIPIWGIAGIALGTLAAFFSDKFFQVIYLSKYIKVPPETYIPLKNLIIYSFILLVCFIISVNNDVIGKIFE